MNDSETTVDSSRPNELFMADIREEAEQSKRFVVRWNRVISATNWEKGKIIADWRAARKADSKSESSYSDETWSRIVGGVTPQHVGRLRRTFERFGATYETYSALYWSHFYAALDWNDAELWLEGAVQNQWSVSTMRITRWETLGMIEGDRPRQIDIVASEPDEESASLDVGLDRKDRIERGTGNFQSEPLNEGPDFGDERAGPSGNEIAAVDSPAAELSVRPRLFESFENLPEDIAQAAEMLKLAIIRHRAKGWSEIDRETLVTLITALKQFANDGDSAPF